MFKAIAHESKSYKEYARRAEAFNSTEAKPQTDFWMAREWARAVFHPREVGAALMDGAWDRVVDETVRAIRKARRARVSKREALWGALVAGVNAEVES